MLVRCEDCGQRQRADEGDLRTKQAYCRICGNPLDLFDEDLDDSDEQEE